MGCAPPVLASTDTIHCERATMSGELLTTLTPRERDVIALVADHYTDRQIGEQLSITEGTVSLHVAHILKKLGVHSRRDAARVYAKAGSGKDI